VGQRLAVRRGEKQEAGIGTEGEGLLPQPEERGIHGRQSPGVEGYQPLPELGTAGTTAGLAAGIAAGIDWGATLAKLAVRRPGRAVELLLLPADDVDACRRALAVLGPARIGVTGGGSGALARGVAGEAVPVNEFAAWGAGAAAMLAEGEARPPHRYLLVSLGTGTSVLLVDGLSVVRVGGTALGGGTLLGLAAGLIGTGEFAQVVELAQRGSRREVDLLVSDIYRAGGIPLAGDLTASNFGKLARRLGAGERVAEADVAQAIVGMIAENVALLCASLAAAAQVPHVVFGGSTLRSNPALSGMLAHFLRAYGREPVFLPRGEFAGAVGALLLACGEPVRA
jgi:type II pantothenate kinase